MAMTIQKLNTMGDAPQGQQKPLQIVNVTYGHNGSGKLYSYYGSNKRAGDVITPEVRHPKSGKVYKTLATVRSTHSLKGGQDTVSYLKNKNINVKTIGKTNQKELPGYYPGWEKDAQAAYDLKAEINRRDDLTKIQKLSLMGEVNQMRKEDSLRFRKER